MPWRLAYHIAVIALHVASAASKKSCGPGAESWPPVATPTSDVNEWLRTRTVFGYSPARRVCESIVFMRHLGLFQLRWSSGQGMNSTASVGILGNCWAFHASRARSILSRDDDTKFHSMKR